jgi:surface polysaccharide O-acyltransferase-like enzyme
VNAVVTGALSGETRENQSRFIKRVTLALISIPIWLIIVLLSPLDAYAAVKNLARQS